MDILNEIHYIEKITISNATKADYINLQNFLLRINNHSNGMNSIVTKAIEEDNEGYIFEGVDQWLTYRTEILNELKRKFT